MIFGILIAKHSEIHSGGKFPILMVVQSLENLEKSGNKISVRKKLENLESQGIAHIETLKLWRENISEVLKIWKSQGKTYLPSFHNNESECHLGP